MFLPDFETPILVYSHAIDYFVTLSRGIAEKDIEFDPINQFPEATTQYCTSGFLLQGTSPE